MRAAYTSPTRPLDPVNTAHLLSTPFPQTPIRKRFHQLAAPFGAQLVLDAQGTILHLTTPARRLLEYATDQRMDPCFFAHVHGKNLYQVMRDIADMVCYGKTRASWLFRLHTGAGRWRWFRAQARNKLTDDEPAIVIELKDLNA